MAPIAVVTPTADEEVGQPVDENEAQSCVEDVDFRLLGNEASGSGQRHSDDLKSAKKTSSSGPPKSEKKREKLSENLRISQRTLNFNPEDAKAQDQELNDNNGTPLDLTY